MDTWAYGIRRDLASFDQTNVCISDKLFAGERLDDRNIEAATFQHCTFANMSFLRARIRNVTFVDCVFAACYFRRAAINGFSFTGCRFLNCDFSFLSMIGTNLLYAKFQGCMIDYEAIRLNLPQEHNLREDLCRNLSVEAGRLGHPSPARLFRLEEIHAREQNLWAAVLWKSEWYRRHYYGARRVRAGLELAWSYVNRFLWGYGERIHTLVIMTALLTFVFLPFLFWSAGVMSTSEDGQMVSLPDLLYMSLQTVLRVDLGVRFVPTSLGARIVTAIGSLAGARLRGPVRNLLVEMDTAAMMSANASAWLYGSYARGDHDEHSDLDVLVVGSDQKKNWHDDFVSAIQKQEVKMSIACYRWGDVESMKSYGSIFLHHLQAEAKPIWEGAHVHGRLREMLVTLPPYGYVPRDILIYRQAVADVRRSLLGGGYVPFELSLLATTLRHAAVLGCYIIQRPNFGRVSAIEAYTRQSGLKAWTSRKVKRLVDYKLWSEGRRAAPKHISLERSALTLCDEVWALIDAVEGDAAWRGLIAA